MAAGAWFDWNTGDLVTEARFQDIQDSIVFIYADETAANAALTNKVEGTLFFDTTDDVIKAWNGSAWISAETGDISAVIAGDGLSGGGTSGSVTLDLDASELTTATAESTDYVVIEDVTDNSTKKALISDIIEQGDITGVTAGDGLSGGGTSGDVTLNVDINSQTSVTAATGDEILIADVSDSNNIKKVTAQSIVDLASGGSVAYSVVDTFAQSGDKSGASVLNNIVNEPEGYGGNLSVSSGVFTFPETGYWLIEAWFNWTRPQNTDLNSKIQVTTNGSSYSTATNNQHGTGSGVESQITCYTNYIFDVTNTSTHKVRFYVDGTFNTYSRLRANGTKEETWFRFSKVADT